MKKFIVFASLVLAASYASATGTFIDKNAGAVNVDHAACNYLPTGAAVKINLSKDVLGAYECNDTSTGVAAAHPQGKKKGYWASSAGGSVTEFSTSAAPAQSDVTGATAQGLSS